MYKNMKTNFKTYTELNCEALHFKHGLTYFMAP